MSHDFVVQGTIHNRRRRVFTIFDTSLPQCDAASFFLLLSVGKFQSNLTSPSLQIADVFYGEPLHAVVGATHSTTGEDTSVPLCKSLLQNRGSFNNYVDKKRGQQMFVFVHAQGTKTVHAAQ